MDLGSAAAAEQHRWAKLIGIIFMPPLVAIGTLVVLSAYLVAEPLVAARTVLVSTLFMAIIPTAYIGFLIRRQRIRGGIELFFAEERLRPYLVCTLSCAIGAVVLIRLSAPQHIWALALGYVLLGILMAAITQHWKISMHAAGSALPTTALLNVLGPTALPGDTHRAARLLGTGACCPAHHPPSCRRDAPRQPGRLARFCPHPPPAVSGPAPARAVQFVCTD